MDNDTVFEEESRFYIDPQTSLDEQTEFINTLRNIQAQNTAEINQNTYNLGSPVTSNIGGLTGSEGLWQAQYQTPQTQATVAGLKAAMQQQALNTELQNQHNFWKNRHNQAQRRYNRAASTYPSTTPQNPSTNQPDINVNTGENVGVRADETIQAVQETLDIPGSDLANLQAYNLQQSNDPTTINSVAFTYHSPNNGFIHGVLHKDYQNKITGATLYPGSNVSGPMQTSYNGQGAWQFVNNAAQQGQLFTSTGQKVNAKDFALAGWK